MPGGPLAVAEGDRIAAPIGRLASHFSTVIATQDWHPAGHVSFAERGGPWPPHCVAGSGGAEVHAALPDELVTLKLRKGTGLDVDSYSGFRDDAGDGTGWPAFCASAASSGSMCAGWPATTACAPPPSTERAPAFVSPSSTI